MKAHSFNGTAYALTGPRDAPLVALIHGVGLNRNVWQWMAPGLSRRYRVLSYDLLGHGQTVPPRGQPTLSDLARQLSDLLDHLGAKTVAIIGFSLGGMVARRFAQDFPDRVETLVILNSPHRRTPAAQAAILSRLSQAQAEGPLATVEAALERWFTPGFQVASPDTLALVRSWVLNNDPQVYPRLYRLLVDGLEEIIAPEPPIRCPTLVMTADEDFGNGPEMSRAIAEEIPESTVVILPGLRHMALAEAPDVVNPPVETFLARVLT